LRSTPASCWRRGRVPSQMTSVFPSFSFSRRDAHQSLMAAMHRSTVFLASCASATGADTNSCLSWRRCDAEYDVRWRRWRHPRSTRWTGPARAWIPVEHCTRQEEQQPTFYCAMYECGMTEWHNCHRTTLPCAKKCICCRTRLLFSCIGVSLLSIVCGVIWSVCMLSAWLRGWYCHVQSTLSSIAVVHYTAESGRSTTCQTLWIGTSRQEKQRMYDFQENSSMTQCLCWSYDCSYIKANLSFPYSDINLLYVLYIG